RVRTRKGRRIRIPP
nr:Chain A, L-22 CYCLIC PEPTIDE [synthetic construct]